MIISNISNFRSTEFDMREFTWIISNVHFHSVNKTTRKKNRYLPVNISFSWFLEFFVSVFVRCAMHIARSIFHVCVQMLQVCKNFFFWWLMNVRFTSCWMRTYISLFMCPLPINDKLSCISVFLAFNKSRQICNLHAQHPNCWAMIIIVRQNLSFKRSNHSKDEIKTSKWNPLNTKYHHPPSLWIKYQRIVN